MDAVVYAAASSLLAILTQAGEPFSLRDPRIEVGAIESVLASRPDQFSKYLANPEEYRLQILLSEVIETPTGPRLERFGYRVDAEYFYPASAIKTCAAVAALRVMKEMRKKHGPEIHLDTPLRFHPLFPGEDLQEHDPSNLQGEAITVGHEIRKLFLVSDNAAFNRLYDLVGHQDLNTWMWQAGLESTRIRHRLAVSRSTIENLHTPKIDFVLDGAFVIPLPERESRLRLEVNAEVGLDIGSSHYIAGDLRLAPMSFADKNRMSLVDLQDMHVMILRPDVDLGKPGFDLSEADRQFLMTAMSEFAHESTNPVYDEESCPDDYVRFLLHGLHRVASPHDLIVYDKVGLAYGFTIENAYVVNKRTGKSFFLTATIHTNSDGVLNDDRYDYEDVALPFWRDLGEALAAWRWIEGGVSR